MTDDEIFDATVRAAAGVRNALRTVPGHGVDADTIRTAALLICLSSTLAPYAASPDVRDGMLNSVNAFLSETLPDCAEEQTRAMLRKIGILK